MTVAYRCDGPGCEVVLDDEATRIDVQIVNDNKIEEMATVDQAEGDEEYHHFAEIRVAHMSFGWSADHHFCSPSCLSSWAFTKGLES